MEKYMIGNFMRDRKIDWWREVIQYQRYYKNIKIVLSHTQRYVEKPKPDSISIVLKTIHFNNSVKLCNSNRNSN